MQYVIGSVVALATLTLAVGAITGRVRVQSCCGTGNPSDDGRLRTADEEGLPSKVSTESGLS